MKSATIRCAQGEKARTLCPTSGNWIHCALLPMMSAMVPAFVRFGNWINGASQDQRRYGRGGWYEQRRTERRPGIADSGKPSDDVIGCRFFATKMRPVSAFHRGRSGHLARERSLVELRRD